MGGEEDRLAHFANMSSEEEVQLPKPNKKKNKAFRNFMVDFANSEPSSEGEVQEVAPVVQPKNNNTKKKKKKKTKKSKPTEIDDLVNQIEDTNLETLDIDNSTLESSTSLVSLDELLKLGYKNFLLYDFQSVHQVVHH